MHTNIKKEINHFIHNMDGITLDEMDHVKLMRRRDTKYVFSLSKLPEILQSIHERYYVLDIQNHRKHPYSTLYYDTSDYEMYNNHHGKRLNRFKVRVREYSLSGIAYLEVKFKNNRGETIKRRINPAEPMNISTDESSVFLKENSPYHANEIAPVLKNSFNRITLVSKYSAERVTIDVDLTFKDIESEQKKEMPGICIIEVKRDLSSQHSDIIKALRKARLQPSGFSKYCMGTAMTNNEVKTNLFKKTLRDVNKINKQLIFS